MSNIKKRPVKKIQDNSLWIFGKHPVFLALESKKREIYQIFVTNNTLKEFQGFLKAKKLHNLSSKIKIVDNKFIETKVGQSQNHQGFAINSSRIALKNEDELISQIESLGANGQKLPKLLILDQLTDPHNIGAIIRSAKAFGVDKIIFPENNFAKETSAMVKSAAGAIELVDLFMITNINKLMEKLKKLDYWCFGLAGEGKSDISQIRKYDNIALIVGSEGAGIRSLVKKNCDILLKIPIQEDVESLNASVACSVALYEMIRSD